MKRLAVLAAALGLAACSESSSLVQPVPDAPRVDAALGAEPGDVVPGRWIVVFRAGVQDAPGLARRLTAAHRGELRHTYTAALEGFAARLPDAAVAALAAHPQVAYVEPDRVVRAIGTQYMDAGNNPWGLDRVDQRDRPLSGTYTYATTGAGVRAYILDTGIRPTHQEFEGRASIGFDAIGDGQDGVDCNGHGTHVAGTVGGRTYGVAKGVALVGVRVLDCGGSGTTSGVIAGIDWVTANHVKPAVANMSLGGGASTSLDDAVRNSIAAGVTYALAAGNGDFIGRPRNACDTSPARVTEALTVGATDSTDHEASFSNYGTCVDVLAPGVRIVSAWYQSDAQLDTISGTSMATPHVAGAAAAYLESTPSATPAAVAEALLSNATTGRITLHSASTSGGTPNRLLYTAFIGGGSTEPPPPAENQPPSASFTESCTNLACDFTDQSTDADGAVVAWSWSFGDGTTSTVQHPSHSYAAAGTYTVTLTVADDDGATSTTSHSVTVSACVRRGNSGKCR